MTRQGVYETYSPDYKLKAVKRVLEEGTDRVTVARELGVESWTLLRWTREYENGKRWISRRSSSRPVKNRPHNMNGSAPPAGTAVSAIPPQQAAAPRHHSDVQQRLARLEEECDLLKRALAHYLKHS